MPPENEMIIPCGPQYADLGGVAVRVFGLWITAFLFVAQGVARDAASPPIVVTATKSWSANGKALGRGQTLESGARLDQDGTQPSDLILNCGKAGWLSYSCRKFPCTIVACQPETENIKTLRLDLSTAKEASSGSFVDWVASLFKREPATLVVLGVREGGHVTDAIVQETPTGIHLGPALNRVLEGKYCFRFTPIPAGSPGASKQAALDWDRSTDAEGAVQVPGMQPGLYSVEKSDSEAAGACTFEPQVTPVWVLVAGDSDYSALEAQWKDFTGRMREMERNGASPTVLLTVRHAALAHLADSVQRTK